MTVGEAEWGVCYWWVVEVLGSRCHDVKLLGYKYNVGDDK